MEASLYFLKNYDKEITVDILSKHYNVEPKVCNVYYAVRDDAKSHGMTQRETAENILKEVGIVTKKQYLDKDSTHPIDQKIFQSIQNQIDKRKFIKPGVDVICRKVLLKRLAFNQYSMSRRSLGTARLDEIIETEISKRIDRTGMSREDIIREAFCLHYNIKT